MTLQVCALQLGSFLLILFPSVFRHLHCPNHIKIEGQDVFSGFQLHSHHYRKPEPYTDKNVLVIGSGPSGTDLSVELSTVAQNVSLHHRVLLIHSIFLLLLNMNQVNSVHLSEIPLQEV